MTEEINLKEFEKLSLEEKAKVWLRDYRNSGDLRYNVPLSMISEITDYCKENDYIMEAGVASKSGTSGKPYGITGKGMLFITD